MLVWQHASLEIIFCLFAIFHSFCYRYHCQLNSLLSLSCLTFAYFTQEFSDQTLFWKAAQYLSRICFFVNANETESLLVNTKCSFGAYWQCWLTRMWGCAFRGDFNQQSPSRQQASCFAGFLQSHLRLWVFKSDEDFAFLSRMRLTALTFTWDQPYTLSP